MMPSPTFPKISAARVLHADDHYLSEAHIFGINCFSSPLICSSSMLLLHSHFTLYFPSTLNADLVSTQKDHNPQLAKLPQRRKHPNRKTNVCCFRFLFSLLFMNILMNLISFILFILDANHFHKEKQKDYLSFYEKYLSGMWMLTLSDEMMVGLGWTVSALKKGYRKYGSFSSPQFPCFSFYRD